VRDQGEPRSSRKKQQKNKAGGTPGEGKGAPNVEPDISGETQLPPPEEPLDTGTSISVAMVPGALSHGGKSGKRKERKEKEQERAKEMPEDGEPLQSSSEAPAVVSDSKQRKKRKVSRGAEPSFPEKLAGVMSQVAGMPS
jgi:hypothetical protein